MSTASRYFPHDPEDGNFHFNPAGPTAFEVSHGDQRLRDKYSGKTRKICGLTGGKLAILVLVMIVVIAGGVAGILTATKEAPWATENSSANQAAQGLGAPPNSSSSSSTAMMFSSSLGSISPSFSSTASPSASASRSLSESISVSVSASDSLSASTSASQSRSVSASFSRSSSASLSSAGVSSSFLASSSSSTGGSAPVLLTDCTSPTRPESRSRPAGYEEMSEESWATASFVVSAFDSPCAWQGYRGELIAPGDNSIVDNEAGLASAFNNLPAQAQTNPRWFRIQLRPNQMGGSWGNNKGQVAMNGSPAASLPSPGTLGQFGGSKDWASYGGGVLIEPLIPGVEIPFSASLRTFGVRGVHIRGNISFSFIMDPSVPTVIRTIDVSTSAAFPEASVITFEGICIGSECSAPNNDTDDFPVGLGSSGTSDVVNLINSKTRGVGGAVSLASTRFIRMWGNDFQGIIKDAMILLNARNVSLVRRGQYDDGNLMIWTSHNTFRHWVDREQYYALHSDSEQHGTSGDIGGYKILSSFQIGYLERVSYRDLNVSGTVTRYVGGTQGQYHDDSKFPIDAVIFNSAFSPNGGKAFNIYNGRGHVERCQAAIPGYQAPVWRTSLGDPYNAGSVFTAYMASAQNSAYSTGGFPSFKHFFTKSIFQIIFAFRDGSITITPSMNGEYQSANYNITNNYIVTWQGSQYSAALSPMVRLAGGNFSRDFRGQIQYEFNNDGLDSQKEFRKRWYEINKIKDPVDRPKYGITDPDTWPEIQFPYNIPGL